MISVCTIGVGLVGSSVQVASPPRASPPSSPRALAPNGRRDLHGRGGSVGLGRRPSRPMPGPMSDVGVAHRQVRGDGRCRAGAACFGLGKRGQRRGRRRRTGGFGGGGGFGLPPSSSLSSGVTATEIAACAAALACATAIRLARHPHVDRRGKEDGGAPQAYSPLLDVDGELGDAGELREIEDVHDIAVHALPCRR